jgi:hypothetical protein
VFKYAAALLLLSWPTSAVVHQDFTFSQWEGLQDDDRAAYIAEFIDMLATMAATQPAQRAARHYTQCIMRSQLTAWQLANFLREYARARPELQPSSVQHAMNDYLNGHLPDDTRIKSLGDGIVCTQCGHLGADVVPNWPTHAAPR